jgi:serine/threonine protein kinase
VKKLGIHIDGDKEDKEEACNPEKPEKKRSSGVNASIARHHRKDLGDGEPLLNWRNRCGNRKDAWSIVGTSQYMAPEVIEGKKYDARCDWWSVGVILFECIYGHTPFLSEDRHETKKNIVNFRETFDFPPRPVVSRRCQHLMLSLITDKDYRLCSERYRMKDLVSSSKSPCRRSVRRPGSSSSSRGRGGGDFAGRYVFPYDAEDIKAHKWFRNIPWERLHELNPPLVPKLRSVDDTHYFEKVSLSDDPSESDPEDSGAPIGGVIEGANTDLARVLQPCPIQGPPTTHLAVAGHHPTGHAHPPQQQLVQHPDQSRSTTKNQYSSPHPLAPWESPVPLPPPTKEELAFLRPLRPFLQELALNVRAATAPLQGDKSNKPNQALVLLEDYMARLPDMEEPEKDRLREFVRRFGGRPAGWRPRRRPRDRLLRDAGTKRIALEVRRRTAFLGYEWRRMEKGGELGMLHPRTEMLGERNVGVSEGEPIPVPLGGQVGGKLKENNHGGVHDSGVGFPAGEGENAHIPWPLHGGVATGDHQCPGPILQQRDRRGGFQPWGGDAALLRALHSGPWSLQ